MARQRRRPASPAQHVATSPSSVPPPPPRALQPPRKWLGYLLAFSLGLLIAGQLGLFAAGDIGDKRKTAIDICLQATAGQPVGTPNLPACPEKETNSVFTTLLTAATFGGVGGAAFALSQAFARRLAQWTYDRRVKKLRNSKATGRG